ncbi:MAG: hypothetical protein GTN68_08555 [Candidatus Aminicenantes bacterium]|nr:hypothetical protein [Candidatus Aminicenantes bacterium]NIO80592.1 hypothetical protein [Candidatus Aminicenantes bacterium]
MMKYPIEIAIWVIGNLDRRDPEAVHGALVFVAQRLGLNPVDSERLSMAFHLVRGRPYFYTPESIRKAETTLEENGETTVLRDAMAEMRANSR